VTSISLKIPAEGEGKAHACAIACRTPMMHRVQNLIGVGVSKLRVHTWRNYAKTTPASIGLGSRRLIAVSPRAQNIMGKQKCALCDCLPVPARAPCAVASPEWYENGHFDPAKRTKELSKQLKLTADRQSQMLHTLESAKLQFESVRSDRSLSRKVCKCSLGLIRQASNDQMSAFLDKKQNTEFARMRSFAVVRLHFRTGHGDFSLGRTPAVRLSRGGDCAEPDTQCDPELPVHLLTSPTSLD
jgi:hypothetical protein